MKTKATLCSLLLFGVLPALFAEEPKPLFRAAAVTLRTPEATPAAAPVKHKKRIVARRDLPAATGTPAPGLYQSVPFSAIVAVPVPIDPGMIIPRGGRLADADAVPPPSTTLIPLHR